MKLYSIQIFIFITTFISNCFSSPLVNQFVNLQVYKDSECKISSDYGIAYSVATYTCLTLDNTNNHYFLVQNGKIIWSRYQYLNVETCEQLINTQTFAVDQCVPYGQINMNKQFTADLQPFFYKLTVSSKAITQKNAVVNRFFGNNCNNESVVVAQYFINGTFVGLTNQYKLASYYCDRQQNLFYVTCNPQKEQCINNVVLDVCQSCPPFYNDSSIFTTSSCQSGSCSITASGSPGFTTSGSSGGGSGGLLLESSGSNPKVSINLNDDTKSTGTVNSNVNNFKPNQRSVDSSEQTYYYYDIYCPVFHL